jgi:hypothetical protein
MRPFVRVKMLTPGRAKWELQRDRDRKLGGYVFDAFPSGHR